MCILDAVGHIWTRPGEGKEEPGRSTNGEVQFVGDGEVGKFSWGNETMWGNVLRGGVGQRYATLFMDRPYVDWLRLYHSRQHVCLCVKASLLRN